MGHIFSSNFVKLKIPEGYDWYIYYIFDLWPDHISKTLENEFDAISDAVGENILVVKCADRIKFNKAILSLYGLEAAFEKELPSNARYYHDDWGYFGKLSYPSFFITNKILSKNRLEDEKIIILPLKRFVNKDMTIIEFFRTLSASLNSEDAMTALVAQDECEVKRYWDWLRFLELKPNFFGFGVNLNSIIDNFLNE